MKLGFIGLGIMGSPMAINLARAGHQLHVTTIGPVADELLSLGAVNVETARQVTEFADIIFIMVPDTPQVEEVLFGEHGCAKTSLQGKTIVDMSSISPIETKRFAQRVNKMGADYLDAPVSGEKSGRVKALCRLWSAASRKSLTALNRSLTSWEKISPWWAAMGMGKPVRWLTRLLLR